VLSGLTPGSQHRQLNDVSEDCPFVDFACGSRLQLGRLPVGVVGDELDFPDPNPIYLARSHREGRLPLLTSLIIGKGRGRNPLSRPGRRRPGRRIRSGPLPRPGRQMVAVMFLDKTSSRLPRRLPRLQTKPIGRRSTAGFVWRQAARLAPAPFRGKRGGDSAPRDPTRFRTIQVCPKDFPAALR
jgi:hypothetical protein